MSTRLRKQHLSIELQQHRPRSTKLLNLKDPFILTSCLQKALRRGDLEIASSAARTLLAFDATRLWRRLVICAFEDFGMSDLDLTADIVSCAADKRWRTQRGGDEHVLNYLIEQMVGCPRDRRTDMLYMLAVRHVRRPSSRADFLAQRPSGSLTDLVLRAEQVVAECEQDVPRRSFRAVLAGKCDRALQSMVVAGLLDDELSDVCAQGRRTSMCLLPVLLPLVKHAFEKVGAAASVLDWQAPEVRLISELPSYALCGFTRLGQEALVELASSVSDIARTIHSLKGRARSNALTYLLFEVEGGVCTRELSDPLHDELKRVAQGCWTGLPKEVIPDGVDKMRAAVPVLNDIRRELWKQRLDRDG